MLGEQKGRRGRLVGGLLGWWWALGFPAADFSGQQGPEWLPPPIPESETEILEMAWWWWGEAYELGGT